LISNGQRLAANSRWRSMPDSLPRFLRLSLPRPFHCFAWMWLPLSIPLALSWRYWRSKKPKREIPEIPSPVLSCSLFERMLDTQYPVFMRSSISDFYSIFISIRSESPPYIITTTDRQPTSWWSDTPSQSFGPKQSKHLGAATSLQPSSIQPPKQGSWFSFVILSPWLQQPWGLILRASGPPGCHPEQPSRLLWDQK
jgi:hypothetical protein